MHVAESRTEEKSAHLEASSTKLVSLQIDLSQAVMLKWLAFRIECRSILAMKAPSPQIIITRSICCSQTLDKVLATANNQ